MRTVLRYALEAIPFTIGFMLRLSLDTLWFVLKTLGHVIALCAVTAGHIFLLLWEGWDAPMFAKQRVRTYRPYAYASSAGTYDPRRGR